MAICAVRFEHSVSVMILRVSRRHRQQQESEREQGQPHMPSKGYCLAMPAGSRPFDAGAVNAPAASLTWAMT